MRTLFCLCLLLTASNLRAECECLWEGSFTDVQGKTELVVSGTVVAAKGNSIDISIDRNLRGTQQREDIRVWLKAADYCRPETDLFPIGSQWVMALSYIDEYVPGGFNPGTPNISYGRQGDYFLSSCGGYWLSQHGDHVTGNLVKAPRWEREPEMTPVLLDLVEDFVNGKTAPDTLLEASREDPELRDLMLDTRAFLRGDE
jgi:hypothetical protein